MNIRNVVINPVKRILVPLFSILLVISLALGCYFYHGDTICAEEVNLSFYMSKAYFKLIKGEPTDSFKNGVTGNFVLTYEENELYGYPAETVYVFQKSFLSWRLFAVSYSLNGLDAEQAKELFDRLNETNS